MLSAEPPWGQPAAALADRLLPRCRFPASGTPVTLAVSGGPDSMALLLLACRAGLEATAVHVDHGLRPGSAGEAELVAAAAARWGAAFEARTVTVAPGPNLEARARRARYEVLPIGVLTGHTADDQAETVLLNVLRGAALDGLAGMAGRARSRHPLLALRRADTVALCAAAGAATVDDASNEDRRFRRNQVRHRVLPLLAEVAGRDLVPVLGRQAALLADDAALLDDLAGGIDPADARALAAAPRPLARRAIRRWLRAEADAEQHPPSSAEVDRVLAVARGDATACQVAGGRSVRRRGGRLAIEAG